MIHKIAVFTVISILLVGCSSGTDLSFDDKLEGMYETSIHQVLTFMELEEKDMEDHERVEKLTRLCEEYISTIEEFQGIERPQEGKNLYDKVNLLAMELSNTLVMLTHSIDTGDTEMLQYQKDNLAFLFIEAGYIGEELGEYLGKENFIEDIMGDFINK